MSELDPITSALERASAWALRYVRHRVNCRDLPAKPIPGRRRLRTPRPRVASPEAVLAQISKPRRLRLR
jgi:hypothetical protein